MRDTARVSRIRRIVLDTSIAAAVVLAMGVLRGVYSNELMLFNFIVFLTLAQGLNIIYGFTGYLPFGYVGFYGAGAYGFALVVMHLHAPALAGMAAAAVAALVLAVILLPLLRLSGAYFAIASMAAAQAVYEIVANPDLEDITKGPYGVSLSEVFAPAFSYYTALAILAATLLLVVWLRNSRFGMSLQAIRDDPISAAMAGVSVVRGRTIAWLLSALVAGLVGGVFAWHISVFYPDTAFDLSVSIFATVFLLFGGATTLERASAGGVHPVWHLQCHRHRGAAVFPVHLRRADRPAGAVPAERPGLPADQPRHSCPLTRCCPWRIWSNASAASARWTASASICTRARCSGWLARTGRARPPASTSSAGFTRRTAAACRCDGRSIVGEKSHRLVKAGINRTFQSPRPFLSLTVRENVEVAAHYGDPEPGFDIGALLALLELDRVAQRPAAELNSAQQKTLDLARAMATEPRLLLVDELAAGLNPGRTDAHGRAAAGAGGRGDGAAGGGAPDGVHRQGHRPGGGDGGGQGVLRRHAGGRDARSGGDPGVPGRGAPWVTPREPVPPSPHHHGSSPSRP